MYSEESSVKDIQHYDVKSVEIRPENFHNWSVECLDKNHLAAAGFYYTNFKNVVCCTFCKVELGELKQEDNPFEEHKRLSLSCASIKCLFVGNIAVGSNNKQPTRSRDVCGSWRGKYHWLSLFFYMCPFLTALITNFQCFLYS